VLSHFPDEVISRILRRHGMAPATLNSIRTEAEFLAEVALTRQRGYALSDEEFVEGLRSIALPFRLADANSPAAIAVVGPTSRFTDEKRLAALEALRIVVEETTRVQDNSKTDSRPNGVGRKDY
jgi:DNA-binding IclR family transcriptional regulator